MARVEAITSEDLVYQVTLADNAPVGRDTEPAWRGFVPPRRPGDPTDTFRPPGLVKVRFGGRDFIDPEIRFTSADGRLIYGYGLICYDFRTNNEERDPRDTSGRPEKRMKDIKRIQSAELTFQVSAIGARINVFYIACLPKINLVRGPLPDPEKLGMNSFLGYNEVYRDPRGRLVGDERSGSGNINPACFAGSVVDRDGAVEPIVLRDSDRYPATITVKLRSRMLRALEQAMRNGDVFGLAAVPIFGFGAPPEQFIARTGFDFWSAGARGGNVAMGLKIRSGLDRNFDPPKLAYRYVLDNSRKNAGFNPGGACASGFSDGANVSAGASSGFFEF